MSGLNFWIFQSGIYRPLRVEREASFKVSYSKVDLCEKVTKVFASGWIMGNIPRYIVVLDELQRVSFTWIGFIKLKWNSIVSSLPLSLPAKWASNNHHFSLQKYTSYSPYITYKSYWLTFVHDVFVGRYQILWLWGVKWVKSLKKMRCFNPDPQLLNLKSSFPVFFWDA